MSILLSHGEESGLVLQPEAISFRWAVTWCKFCLKTMILSVWESGSQGGRAEAGKPREAAESDLS